MVSGELVFLALAVDVDDLPDRLAQLGVLERPVIRCREFTQIGRRRSNPLGPPFEHEHSALVFGAVEYLTGGSVGQVNVVDDFSEFFDETNTQTHPKGASRSLAVLGGYRLVIALFITVL
jgi:hypothetical protein